MSDIDTAEVDSLKALDPEWPIREADIDRAEIPQCSSQRPLDSERFKMGARNALIRKRFYKKRDCKNSLIQGVARETRRGKPPGAFCSSSRSAGTCARASAFNASSGLAGLLRDGHYYQQGVSHESPRHQYGRRRRAVRPHIRAGIGNANEQSRRRSERPRARPKRAVSPPPLPVPIGA